MSSPLQRLWKDKMDIYRYKNVTVDGFTENIEVMVSEQKKCHYSKSSLTETGDNGVPTITNSYLLFCALEIDIREGDKVIVTQRNGKKTTLAIGEGFPYSNHQEFKVKRDDKA